LAAMTLALAHSRGWLDYEERVATYDSRATPAIWHSEERSTPLSRSREGSSR